MKKKSRPIIILTVLFGYIILQFLWWEILLVKQTGQIIEGKQKLIELSSTNPDLIIKEVKKLHLKKQSQVLMVVGEGSVFLLLLIFGIYKIKQAHTKEESLSNQQKNFFLSITHELKTPIAAAKLQLQTLQKHKLDTEKQNELIANALTETERLNLLIDNVLLAGRLDAGEINFKKEKADVSELTEKTLNRYYKTEISKNELTFNLEKNIFLEMDVTAFPSIITNLVDNAFKYSFDNKSVTVDMIKINETVQFRVNDKGCGVSETDKNKIFKKFYRAGNEETRSTKGTGLGLYIVNYIVQQHNGVIRVKNNIPKGSIFEIEFMV